MQASVTCMGKSPMVKVILEARTEVDMESTAQDAMYTQNTADQHTTEGPQAKVPATIIRWWSQQLRRIF